MSITNPTPVLEVRHLSTWYVSARGTRVSKALNDVSFTLHAGGTLGIVGESGCGKSTLALSVLRLLAPAARIVSGEIILDGENLLQKTPGEMQRIRGKEIAMILQDPMASLNPLIAIGSQVAEPLRYHGGRSRKTAALEAISLMASVRISEPALRAGEYPHQMSGGMRQRIVGAIAVSCGPKVLIADEPTTSLDLTIQAQYLDLLRDIQRERGLGMIFITHDLGIVARMCDHVAVMYAGRIVETGTVHDIFTNPAHPYTEALLRSRPQLAGGTTRLHAIKGYPPDPTKPSQGCAFHPRCLHAMPVCQSEEPPELVVRPQHHARCWLHAGADRTSLTPQEQPVRINASRGIPI